jgi:hypothetical protein
MAQGRVEIMVVFEGCNGFGVILSRPLCNMFPRFGGKAGSVDTSMMTQQISSV